MSITPMLDIRNWPAYNDDDIFSADAQTFWVSPLDSYSMTGSDDSPPTHDFAFGPPADGSSAQDFDTSLKTPTFNSGSQISPNGYTPNFSFNNQPYLTNSSSFSSTTSGSATGASFSSADALPAISRNFVRPSTTETRRPATAGAAFHPRSPFGGMLSGMDKMDKEIKQPETIDESPEGLFANPNPFDLPVREEKLNPTAAVDPYVGPTQRRASEASHYNAPTHPYENHPSYPLASAPPHISNFQQPMVPPQQQNIHTQMQQSMNRAAYSSRPQTSDGIPHYSGLHPSVVSLPSARTLVNNYDNSPVTQNHFFNSGSASSLMPFRDNRAASMGDVHHQQAQHQHGAFPGSRGFSLDAGREQADDDKSELTFVSLGGPAPKKRPRRRFDEIERLYKCGWNGCEKAYGTLNHLNAHVAMQKHGEKRLPQEFKEMRKQWRKKKREQTAAQFMGQGRAESGWTSHRPSVGSISTESEFDRRDSAISAYSTGSEFSHRASMSYPPGYGWNNAPESSRPGTGSSIASSIDARYAFGGAYPQPMMHPGQAPQVRRPSAPTHLPIPNQQPQVAFRPIEGEHPTPTQHNPFPQPRAGPQQNQFSFQTLTSPMPLSMPAGNEVHPDPFAFR